MRETDEVTIADVAAFYGGNDVDVLELVMGEQIHVGGLDATLDLAGRAGIGAGQRGVDLCCCNGAGMRALVRLCGVDAMIGVDISAAVIERGVARGERDGVADRIRFVEADACSSGLPDDGADFVWSEDAWVYVPDKAALVSEAVRIVRPGGMIAFTDWVEGPAGLTDDEATRLMASLQFPSIETIDGYVARLENQGVDVVTAEDTGAFGSCMAQYAAMLATPLKYDALARLDFDEEHYELTMLGFSWLAELGHAGKLIQARFVARAT